MRNTIIQRILSIFFLILISTRFSYTQENAVVEFAKLNTLIRDNQILKEEARSQIRQLIPKIKEYFKNQGGVESNDQGWIFPLQGYSSSAIGGVNGSGYTSQGYDYFDGNRHGGHPAHDIFIHDRNQDGLDDITKNPVNVLSMINGVVVAAEPNWDTESTLRGGKYIYIYDPSTDGLFYYAHNSEIFVKPGDMVKAGDVIAHVGRTGLNAYKQRSPTHLHIMYLYVDDGYPKPYDIYDDLVNAKTR